MRPIRSTPFHVRIVGDAQEWGCREPAACRKRVGGRRACSRLRTAGRGGRCRSRSPGRRSAESASRCSGFVVLSPSAPGGNSRFPCRAPVDGGCRPGRPPGWMVSTARSSRANTPPRRRSWSRFGLRDQRGGPTVRSPAGVAPPHDGKLGCGRTFPWIAAGTCSSRHERLPPLRRGFRSLGATGRAVVIRRRSCRAPPRGHFRAYRP